MARANHLTVEPLNPTIGAELRGVDLRELSDAAVEDIRVALLRALSDQMHWAEIFRRCGRFLGSSVRMVQEKQG